MLWTRLPLALFLVAAPFAAPRAQEPAKSRYEILKERAEAEAAREQEWRKRYAKQIQRVQNAQKRLEEIEASRTWSNRGVTRQQEDQALTELKQAQSALDKLHEQARREGVPPGWLRD